MSSITDEVISDFYEQQKIKSEEENKEHLLQKEENELVITLGDEQYDEVFPLFVVMKILGTKSLLVTEETTNALKGVNARMTIKDNGSVLFELLEDNVEEI